jgi:hypothetical protein
LALIRPLLRATLLLCSLLLMRATLLFVLLKGKV